MTILLLYYTILLCFSFHQKFFVLTKINIIVSIEFNFVKLFKSVSGIKLEKLAKDIILLVLFYELRAFNLTVGLKTWEKYFLISQSYYFKVWRFLTLSYILKTRQLVINITITISRLCRCNVWSVWRRIKCEWDHLFTIAFGRRCEKETNRK